MIHSGDTISNSITGETIHFVTASIDTGGTSVLVEVLVDPRGSVAAPHVHPYQTEVFEIIEGELTFRADGNTFVARAGEAVTVTPGMPHRFWNATKTRARFRCEIRPALRFEQLIETMFALANDGKTNRNGIPNPFRLAVIANAHFDDVRLPTPSARLQRTGLLIGAAVGRLLGYEPTYDPAPSTEAAQPAI